MLGASPEESADAPLDPGVAERLVQNQRAFLAFVEKRVGSRSVAEDIVQQAFARGLEHLNDLRTEESALAWFYRLLRNAIVDHHRRGAARSRGLEALAHEVAAEAPGEDAVSAEVCRCVGELARTLKPEYAEILKEVEVGGTSLGRYAEEHGLTQNNAAVRAFRARQALRRQVVRACGSCATHGCLDCTCGEPKRPAP